MAHALFSYGTLRDPHIQHELFGKILPYKKGRIKDWGLYVGNHGYLFVKPLAGDQSDILAEISEMKRRTGTPADR